MNKSLKYVFPFLIGITLLPIPLLRDLHFESAMLAGTIGCFWGGILAASSTSKQDLFNSLRILGIIYIAAIPLFVFAVISGCLTLNGIGFWIFIPVPSVFLGTATGRFLRKLKVPYPNFIVILTLLLCAVGVLLIEFFRLPQVYFYNHVWGLWPGPIYDEAVNLTDSFLLFRFITLLWIILLWVIPDWNKGLTTKLISAFVLVLLTISYLNLDGAGIISPTKSIQAELGGHHQTEHFELYYDEEFYSPDEVRYWAVHHEFNFHQIIHQLDIEWPEEHKIESYLYAHAWQKKTITGAKFTSYVPIWLDQDQLHIAKQQLDQVLRHELVHVISKQFGNSLFNGSWSIGLIEGLSEGISGDASPLSTLHQIVAAEQPWPDADEMRSALSLTGFYGSAGAISYTTSGSFVKYLLTNYPVKYFKKAYHTANIEKAYPFSFNELINGWHGTLKNTEIDSVDQQVSEFIFAQRSLFQKDCPHSISEELKHWDKYNYLLASKDTIRAYNVLNDLYELNSENALIKAEWIRSKLELNEPGLVVEQISDSDSLLNLKVLQADALFLSKGYKQAAQYLSKYSSDITKSSAENFRFTLELRRDSTQWSFLLKQRYSDQLVGNEDYLKMNTPNKMLSLGKALDLNHFDKAHDYLSLMPDTAYKQHWFKIIEKAIHKLAFIGEYTVANNLIDNMNNLSLRARYGERLSEQLNWVSFLQNRNYIGQ
ncbi:hypothetical protein ACKGJO_12385 [Gracilimonas sp. Q87]|uniref:hypothetical protein n=1 Tax=Gracilimonas sp. Q87 TaxID=3384766 RepID=UPI0039842BE1